MNLFEVKIMKTKEKKGILLGLICALILAIIGFVGIRTENTRAYGEETEPEPTEEFIVSSDTENVAATYEFIKINDTECKVRITNRTEATKAIIPSVGEIDGKEYKVTEVAGNGFMSASKLIRVSLPHTIKKIGNSAFSNCKVLNRINLSNVEEIGSSVFMRCPELKEIVIPKSVVKMGTYVFRNNDTLVRVRAEAAGGEWKSSWNSNNENRQVEYNSTYVQPLELEPVYDTMSRSASPAVVAYNLASGQPRTDDFYMESEDDAEIEGEGDTKNIFIPATHEGKDIIGIQEYAFSGSEFNQLIIEYSPRELIISGGAFEFTLGTNITINRSVVFWDEEMGEESANVFTGSTIKSVVFPDTLTLIPNSAFTYCESLENIFFMEPTQLADREAALNSIETLQASSENVSGVVRLPNNSAVTSISENAFMGTIAIKELHLDDTIVYVGPSVIAEWNDEEQTVYIHNEGKITGWADEWNSTFTNIVYDKVIYTITFNPDGGAFVGSDEAVILKDVVFGEEIGDMPEATLEHYEFQGWYSESGEKFVSTTIYEVESDIELTARWKKKVYTIQFDAQGGEGGPKKEEVTWGEPFPEGEAPERLGHIFKGYYDEPNGQGSQFYNEKMQSIAVWAFEGITELTLYADWEVISDFPFTVTYELNGGTDNGGNPETVTYSDTVILKDAVHDTLYFDGWLYNGKKIEKLEYIEENITLVAQWINPEVIHITSAFTDLSVTGVKTIVVFDMPFSEECTLTVEANCNLLEIEGNGYTYNMTINVADRVSDITLTLKNISIKGPIANNAIIVDSEVFLNIYAYGTVNIEGGKGAGFYNSMTGVGYPGHGFNAIVCYKLNINYADNLTIKGGDGNLGFSGNFKYPNGVDGGDGAYAVYVTGNYIYTCDNVSFIGGNGGDGGDVFPGTFNTKGGKGGSGCEPICPDLENLEFDYPDDANNIHFEVGQDGEKGMGGVEVVPEIPLDPVRPPVNL